INVDVELLDNQTMAATGNRDGTKAGVGAIGWGWNYNPPFNFDRFFTAAFAPPNGANWGFYSNPEGGKVLADIARTVDRDERIKLYQKAETIITDDAPWLFLYHPIEARIFRKNLTWASANSVWYTLRTGSLS